MAGELDVDAVCVANHQMAIGVLRALAEAGRMVADDVSVVGFDDGAEAECLVPPLSMVRLDFCAVGRAAVGLLLCLVNSDERDGHVVAPTELVVRTSSIRDHDARD